MLKPGMMADAPSGLGGTFTVKLIKLQANGRWLVRVVNMKSDFDGFEFAANPGDLTRHRIRATAWGTWAVESIDGNGKWLRVGEAARQHMAQEVLADVLRKEAAAA